MSDQGSQSCSQAGLLLGLGKDLHVMAACQSREDTSGQSTGIFEGKGFFLNLFNQHAEQPVNYKHCLCHDGDGPAHLLLPAFSILPFSCNLEPALRLPPGPAYLPQVHKHVLNASTLPRTHLLAIS